MKRNSILLVLAAASLVTSLAFGADKKVTASFETLSSSGISGQAELSAMPQGGTLIHETLRGLQPNTEYVSIFYLNGTCSPEAASAADVIQRFQANAAGIANFSQQVNKDLLSIKSVSVQLVSDLSVQACAAVNP